MTLELRETDDGILIPVQVVLRASRTGIDGEVEGALRVRLAAPPVDGAANRELIEFLSKRLRLPKRDLTLVTGERSKRKAVRVWGLSRQEILERLQGTA
ncbi:MAG TPA: DUF167 domain-containing protein [Nitrolancea sp.]|nr:DUF167 domain-containing protein [Nitrolancea sp.]